METNVAAVGRHATAARHRDAFPDGFDIDRSAATRLHRRVQSAVDIPHIHLESRPQTDVAGSGNHVSVHIDPAQGVQRLHQNVSGSMRGNRDAVVRRGAATQDDISIPRSQHDRSVSAGRPQIGLRRVRHGRDKRPGTDPLHRHRDTSDNEGKIVARICVQNIDSATIRAARNRRNPRFDGVRASSQRTDSVSRDHTETRCDHIDVGVAVVQNRTGGRDDRNVASRRDTAEQNIGLGENPHVSVCADKTRTVGHRHRTARRFHIDRSGCPGLNGSRGGNRNGAHRQNRDVSTSRKDASVENHIAFRSLRVEKNVPRPRRRNSGRRARTRFDRDRTGDRLQNDASIRRRQRPLLGDIAGRRAPRGENFENSRTRRADSDAPRLEKRDRSIGRHRRNRLHGDFQRIRRNTENADSARRPQLNRLGDDVRASETGARVQNGIVQRLDRHATVGRNPAHNNGLGRTHDHIAARRQDTRIVVRLERTRARPDIVRTGTARPRLHAITEEN